MGSRPCCSRDVARRPSPDRRRGVARGPRGSAGGGLNALVVTKLRIHPLIVTLGTYSLFRGLAEESRAARPTTRTSPRASSSSDRGDGGRRAAAALHSPGGVSRLLAFSPPHDRGAGALRDRFLDRRRAIRGDSGESPDRARLRSLGLHGEPGLDPVRLAQRAGQGGCGLEYELQAITAVVLGGTSIFGGRGTILGTLLGLFAIVGAPAGSAPLARSSELAGILVGVLSSSRSW